MKKFLLSLLTLCAALAVNAQTEVTFDFDNNATDLFGIAGRSSGSGSTAVTDGDFTEDVTATVDGVSLTVSPSNASTANRLWTTAPVLRVYGGTMTFSAPGKKILGIVFVAPTWDKNNKGSSFDSGSFDSGKKTWSATSDVESVVLTIGSNTQIRSLTVTVADAGEVFINKPVASVQSGTYLEPFNVELTAAADATIYYQLDGEGYEEYTSPIYIDFTCKLEAYAQVGANKSDVAVYEYTIATIEGEGEGTVEAPYDVTRALSIINSNSYTSDKVYVKGKISKIDNIDTGSYGNATYFISNDGTENGELEIYRGYALGGLRFTAEDEIKVGDEVVVYGTLTLYNTTPEMTSGSSIYMLNGKTYQEPEPPSDLDGTGEGTAESPYNVTRALDIIGKGAMSASEVYVAGKVSSIKEVDTGSYGNATYNISVDGQEENVLVVYRGYYLKGEKFTATDQLNVGDEVVVCGKLIAYTKDDVTTAQVGQGSKLISINGKTEPETPVTPPYEVVGDGSMENPYTVADIAGMKVEESDGNKYWVKGYILGSASSATKLNAEDKAVDTNIAIAATPDADTFIPVAIPFGPLRATLGVATNPGNIGKEVMVYGTLEKYFSVAGVKNITEYILDGNHITDGIVRVGADNENAKIYDITGREQSKLQKGLNIVNGKKIMF